MLKKIISQGDHVAIVDGILQIIPASRKPVPDDWYNDNKQRLITAIAKAVSVTAYCYTGYTTGKHEVNKGRLVDGVSLQFVNIFTGENLYAAFNVGLKRVQASRCGKHKAGDPLKKKRFTPPENGAFCKFIERSNLPKPRHISESSEKMGQLKERIFTMTAGEKNKAINETLISLSVTYDDIVTALNMVVKARGEFGGSSGRVRETIGQNVRAANGSKPDNTRLTGNSSYMPDSLQLKLTRKDSNTDALHASNILNTPNTKNTYNEVAPQEQSIEEWLSDYG